MDEPHFTYINVYVCYYCKNRSGNVLPGNYGDTMVACLVNKDENGKFKRVGIDSDAPIYSFEGCDKFESSGLPCHTSIIEELVKQNPKCSSIPVDEKATESSWEFGVKSDRYLPKESFHVSFDDVALKRDKK